MGAFATKKVTSQNWFERIARHSSYLTRVELLRDQRETAQLPELPLLCTAEQSLRDAILTAPENDKIRLLYADWLEKNNDPARAQFIRAQIALVQSTSDWEREQIQETCADLLRVHRKEWLRELKPWSPRECIFRRGFVEAVQLTGRSFISRSEGLFKTAPIDEVQLIAITPILNECVEHPAFARLKKLNLWGNQIGNSGLAMLIERNHLEGLHSLNLSQNGLTAKGVNTLARQFFPSLETLDLAGNPLDGEMANLLDLPSISHLNLARTGANDRCLVALVNQPRFSQLIDWNLSQNQFTLEGLRVLFQVKENKLSSLNLSHNRLGDEGFILWCQSGSWDYLRHLDLGWNQLGLASGMPLGDSTQLEKLESLSLAGNYLDDAFLQRFSQVRNPSSLRRLDLTANRLSAESVEALLHSQAYRKLASLNLTSNFISDQAIERILQTPGAIRLKNCVLAFNQLSDRGIKQLAQSPAILSWRHLDLRGNDIGYSGAKALAGSPYLEGIRTLKLAENPRLGFESRKILENRFQNRVSFS